MTTTRTVGGATTRHASTRWWIDAYGYEIAQPETADEMFARWRAISDAHDALLLGETWVLDATAPAAMPRGTGRAGRVDGAVELEPDEALVVRVRATRAER